MTKTWSIKIRQGNNKYLKTLKINFFSYNHKVNPFEKETSIENFHTNGCKRSYEIECDKK